jgi:hypothetical protein
MSVQETLILFRQLNFFCFDFTDLISFKISKYLVVYYIFPLVVVYI